jgi:endonuclease/exonuclease/phosphatase family metal-dependent hydrolase
MAKHRKIWSAQAGDTCLAVLSILWLGLAVAHLFLAGRIPFWIYVECIPPFCFMVIPILLLGLELFQKNRKWFRILPAVLALGVGATQLDINLARQESIPVQAGAYTEIKVFNWNTNMWDQQKNRRRFVQYLKKQNADIYMFQEYLHAVDPALDLTPEIVKQRKLFKICSAVPGFPFHYQPFDDMEKIKREFPGYYTAINQQFLIISRFPIVASHGDFSDQYAVTDIDVHGRIIRFFNVHILLHLESPLMPDFYASIKRRFVARRLAYQNLAADIQKTATDYLVAGDFNSTTAMGVMNGLFKNHIDTVNYSGELIPLTFEFSGLKLWRFDFAFVPKAGRNMRVKSYQCLNPGGFSDHSPLSLVLNIPDGSGELGRESAQIPNDGIHGKLHYGRR